MRHEGQVYSALEKLAICRGVHSNRTIEGVMKCSVLIETGLKTPEKDTHAWERQAEGSSQLRLSLC